MATMPDINYNLESPEAKEDRSRAFALIAAWLNVEERLPEGGRDEMISELMTETMSADTERIAGVIGQLSYIASFLTVLVKAAEEELRDGEIEIDKLEILHRLQRGLDEREIQP